MTDAVAKPLNFGLPRRNLARRGPPVLALKKPERPLPAVSAHVPVTPQNRSRLRALRQAEMKAWNAAAGFDTGHFERRQAAEKERRDLRAFGLIAALAVATVTISLVKSPAFVQQWTGLVKFVRQLIG